MLSKWLFALLIGIIASTFWIVFNPSYQKSFQSRVYYAIGNYDEAYSLAKESFELDPYNRMASTVMVQSQTALKFVRYNEEAEKYKKEIRRISEQKTISPAQRAKIRTMAAIMTDSYRKIAPTVITDKELVRQAKSNYEQFKMLQDELNTPR